MSYNVIRCPGLEETDGSSSSAKPAGRRSSYV
jgi:hypothetical protein